MNRMKILRIRKVFCFLGISLLLAGCSVRQKDVGESIVALFSDENEAEKDVSSDDRGEKDGSSDDRGEQERDGFKGQRADWIQSDGEWLYFANAMDDNRLYRCKKDGSGLMKLSEDSLQSEQILLGEGQVFYLVGLDTMQAIVRVNCDGTERTVLADSFFYNENGEGLQLEYYADGLLYYWYAPETIGSLCGLPRDGGEVVKFGSFPQSMAIEGEYLYYIDGNFMEDQGYFLGMRNRETEEETVLLPELSSTARIISAEDGWIYYLEDGALNGFDVDRKETEKLDMDFPPEMAYSLKMMDGTIYYLWKDQYYAVNLTSKEHSPIAGNAVAFCDGDFYLKTPCALYWSYLYVQKKGSAEVSPLFVTDGWVMSHGEWYFYEKGRLAVDGWKDIDGKSYYFSPYGELYTSTTTPDGFWVDENGVRADGPREEAAERKEEETGYAGNSEEKESLDTVYTIDFDGLVQFTVTEKTLRSSEAFIERFNTDTNFASAINDILFDVSADWKPEKYSYQGGIFRIGVGSDAALVMDTNRGTAYFVRE